MRALFSGALEPLSSFVSGELCCPGDGDGAGDSIGDGDGDGDGPAASKFLYQIHGANH